MNKYIDAEKLTELILQTEKEFTEKSETKGYTTLEYQHKAEGLQLALQYITYLQQEQPEVDLEEEIKKYCRDYYNCIYPDQIQNGSCSPIMPHIVDAARRFWFKGYNARK